ncbi:MAG TPA: crossover junction endodeoxyribonuclease RuvC [Anaeromyxobacteraceae bacterium]|nr:crossover junction endodeoxyribonuclease RuvC [Anaeromyxobacteraceae bacterium]
MSVLGIDPGTRRCGYAVVDRRGTRLVRIASGVLAVGDGPMAERLGTLLDALLRLADGAGVEAVAVETAYCGRSARSALALGLARGVALAAAARAGRPVYEYAPAEVKRAFTGSGRAEKAQMVSTARMLFGLSPRLPDEADALAVAVCHLARGALRPLAPSRPAAGAAAAASRLRPSVRRFAGAP